MALDRLRIPLVICVLFVLLLILGLVELVVVPERAQREVLQLVRAVTHPHLNKVIQFHFRVFKA